MTLRIGTRRSPLAQAQTDRVIGLLPAGAAEKVLLSSEGDLDVTRAMHRMGRPGAFTSTLTDAILDGRIDAAVHSLKDLPLQAPAGAPVVAILRRDSPADALLVRDAARDAARPLGLRSGARVGTSAPRRQSQMLAEDPEVVPVDVRGNVQRRLELLERGVIDALLMAEAALERLALPLPPTIVPLRLDPQRFPAGPGQGAIAVQARAGSEAERALRALDDAQTRAAVELERALLGRLGGGCGLPLGAFAQPNGASGWRLVATFGRDGWESAATPRLARADAAASSAAAALDDALAQLDAPEPPAREPSQARVVALTLEPAALAAYEQAFAAAGWRAVPLPLVESFPTGAPPPAGADRAGWVAVASPRAAPHAAAHLAQREAAGGGQPRVAALGAATARALRRHGLPVHVVSPDATGESLADAVAAFPAPPAPVLLPRSARALPDLPDGLRRRGFDALPWPVYDVRTRSDAPRLPPDAEALVLTSPSTAEALVALKLHVPDRVRLVAFGPSTADAMRRAGLRVDAVVRARSPSGILEVLP